jgi:ribosomal protein L16 Arg81 hydroxylase
MDEAIERELLSGQNEILDKLSDIKSDVSSLKARQNQDELDKKTLFQQTSKLEDRIRSLEKFKSWFAGVLAAGNILLIFLIEYLKHKLGAK